MKKASLSLMLLVCLTASAYALDFSVVDVNGKPIPSAKVLVTSYALEKIDSKTMTSDKNGRFKYSPKTDSYFIQATADGCTYGSIGNIVGNEQKTLLTLWPEKEFTGKVVDENGEPLAGVKIELKELMAYTNTFDTQINYTVPGPTVLTDLMDYPDALKTVASTNERGVFVLHHIPEPNGLAFMYITITVSKPGYALVEADFEMEDLGTDIVITDPGACVLKGTLYLPDKEAPAPEGVVLLAQLPGDDEMPGQSYAAVTQKDGSYQFSDLQAGSYTVTMMPYIFDLSDPSPQTKVIECLLPAARNVEVTPQSSSVLELEAVNPIEIKGSVIDKATGSIAKTAWLTVTDLSRPDSESVATSDETKEFTVRVVPGEVTLSVDMYECGEEMIMFTEEEAPRITLTAVEGREIGPVTIVADSSLSSQRMQDDEDRISEEPAIPDIVLESGTYHLTWDAETDCSGVLNNWPDYEEEEALAYFKKMPDFASEKPYAAAFKIDGNGEDGLLLVVLDESKGTGTGYDTVYLDTNRNGDLSDEKPVTYQSERGTFDEHLTPWVGVQSRQGNGAYSNPTEVKLEVYPSDEYMFITLYRKGFWHGKIKTNKGDVDLGVLDVSGNSLYNDAEEWSDMILADVNGSGRLAFSYYGTQSMNVNDIIAVADKFYHIDPSPEGDTVTIERYGGPKGTLLIEAGDICGLAGTPTSISLEGTVDLTASGDEAVKPITLPVGKYSINYCTITLKSGNKTLLLEISQENAAEIVPHRQTLLVIEGDITAAISPDEETLKLKAGSEETVYWLVKIGDATASVSQPGNYRESVPSAEFFNSDKTLGFTTKAGYT